MVPTLVNNTPPDEWLTTTEVAKRLGCHRNTARHMADAGAFPNAIKLRRDWRVPAADVEAYIQQQRAERSRE
ncbi:helix-turn-helix domain-containing protein [Phycisphaerales bacterium AB-hyl4]|uniref:Helix-turn-helix domain-containing protein n=1 Tax=Natronomicrosphaera hydrolytica TaxID=3242702 RepID=A0ABV4U8Q0_9BACT